MKKEFLSSDFWYQKAKNIQFITFCEHIYEMVFGAPWWICSIIKIPFPLVPFSPVSNFSFFPFHMIRFWFLYETQLNIKNSFDFDIRSIPFYIAKWKYFSDIFNNVGKSQRRKNRRLMKISTRKSLLKNSWWKHATNRH